MAVETGIPESYCGRIYNPNLIDTWTVLPTVVS